MEQIFTTHTVIAYWGCYCFL